MKNTTHHYETDLENKVINSIIKVRDDAKHFLLPTSQSIPPKERKKVITQ